MKGTFITFEGGEGSGKSTVIKMLEKRLVDEGYKVVVTREPGGVKVSEEIREVILKKENKMAKETEALLYAASRVEHLYAKVVPYLEQGYIVLSDRYLDSSIAYQGYARGVGLEKVLALNVFALDYMPKRTYFFDVTPEVGLARIQGREKIDRLDLESMDFHQKVYEGYNKVCELYPDRVVRLDGTKTPEEILEDLYNDLIKVL